MVTRQDHSCNECTSEEGEKERGLRRGERGECHGAKGAGNERARERTEEEDEEQRTGGECRTAEARGHDAEADPPEQHPQHVRHTADCECQQQRWTAESPGRQECASTQFERERGGLMAKAQSNQRSRGGGPPQEADRKSGSKSVG